jgi:hypothetical protein
VDNLNKIRISLASCEKEALQDHMAKAERISVYFRDLVIHLCRFIEQAEAVVGAVAWLQHELILKELAKKEMTSIIISGKNLYLDLRKKYELMPKFEWDDLNDGLLGNLIDENHHPIKQWEAIRCIKPESTNTRPLMHHKFLLFCKLEPWQVLAIDLDPFCSAVIEDMEIDSGFRLVPYAV